MTCFQDQQTKHREYSIAPQFPGEITVISDACWASEVNHSGIGFIILAGFKHIVIAGSCGAHADSSSHAEAIGMLDTLEQCSRCGLKLANVLTDCMAMLELIQHIDHAVARRIQGTTNTI